MGAKYYVGDVTFKEHELCVAKLSLVLSHMLTTKARTINAVFSSSNCHTGYTCNGTISDST